jgi:hypothetical protein
VTSPAAPDPAAGPGTGSHAGQGRRTLTLEQQLDDAHRANVQVLLTGPGTNDLLVTAVGRSRRLPAFLYGYCADRGLGYLRYSLTSHVTAYETLPDGRAVPVTPGLDDDHPARAVPQVLTDMRTSRLPALLLFDYADSILGADRELTLELSMLVEHLQVLAGDTDWHQAGLRLVLADRGGGVTSRLTNHPGIRQLRVGGPDQAERTVFVGQAMRARTTARLHLASGLSEEEAGRRTGGLLNVHIHELRSASSPDGPVTARQISDAKAKAIKDSSGGALEVMGTTVTFDDDVAGLPAVRLALRTAQLAGRGTLRILLAGPPGTGKTLAFGAIADALNVPAIRYGEILNEYVGVAERNMSRANAILREMAPLALFIDEADQTGLGARGIVARGSEVHQNLRAALFEFLGDSGEQSGITVVATTNVPTRLDDAALSRFTVIPVLFASGPELAGIMVIHARRAGIPMAADPAAILTAHTLKVGALSGRSVVEVLSKAWDIALRAGDQAVEDSHVEAALAGWIGDDWTVAAEYSTLTSLLAAKHADAWPWEAARRLGEQYDIPSYLTPYLTATGAMDTVRMRERVAELDAARTGGW